MTHYKEVCRYCGAIIMQCRCPGPKEIRYGVCDNCASGGRVKKVKVKG